MSREPLLQMKEITYSYERGKCALDQISLELYEGEKIAVVGSNGAGKSTFFLTMNGVLSPDSGGIYYRGSRVGKKDLNELRKNVGIVFQNPDNQIVASSVYSEVAFGPMNLKLPTAEVKRRTEKALDYMGIQSFSDRPPHYLSGGEKKRVTIADIIAMQSDIFVFDEPASSLDPAGQRALGEVLDRLHREGKTIILSTHDMDMAYRFAERVLVFSGGKIVADGSAEDIFADEELLAGADLKRPLLLEIYTELVKAGKAAGKGKAPKNTEELLLLLH